MISVIVPVYNVELYLRECVDSILSQSYQDFELILVDDGSSDRSGEICDEYGVLDSRIRVLHQKNGGVSVARNTGLDVAKGEYITFVDSDDYVLPDYLSELLAILKKENAEISSCRAFIEHGVQIAEEATVAQSYRVYSGKDICTHPYRQIDTMEIASWGKLYHRSLWEGIRFPIGKIHEDQAVVPVIFYKAKKVVATQRKLYYYRIVETSIMHKPFSLKRYDDLDAVDICIAFFEDHNEMDIAALAQKHKECLLAVYSICSRKCGIYSQLPPKYRMSEQKALRILRKAMSDDKYTYYLAMLHPKWLRPHAYLRKIKKILHIPCK